MTSMIQHNHRLSPEVIERTFLLRSMCSQCGVSSQGTCFVLDYKERSYMITAAHVVQYAINNKHKLSILYNKKFIEIPETGIGCFESKHDTAVLLLDDNFLTKIGVKRTQKMTNKKSENSGAGRLNLSPGQEVTFVGFPTFGNEIVYTAYQGEHPIPMIKRGNISYVSIENSIMYIDGVNNLGFSGGPIIISIDDTGSNLRTSTIGLVSGVIGDGVGNVMRCPGLPSILIMLEEIHNSLNQTDK